MKLKWSCTDVSGTSLLGIDDSPAALKQHVLAVLSLSIDRQDMDWYSKQD